MFKLRAALPLVVASILALVPMAASAAYTSPSELMTALRAQGMPVGFSMEIHGNAAPYYASAWMNGTMQEKAGSLMMTSKDTVDLVLPDGKIRFKGQARQMGATSYMILDSVNGTFDDAATHAILSFEMKKWLQLPGSEMGMMSPVDTSASDSALDMQFTLSMKTTKNGNVTYTLTPTEAALEGLRSGLQSIAADAGHPEANFSSAMLNVTITTDAKGNFVSAEGTVTAKDGALSFTLKGTSWKATGTFTVTKPVSVYSMDEGIMGLATDWPMWIGQFEGAGGSMMMPTNDWSSSSDASMGGDSFQIWSGAGSDSSSDTMMQGASSSSSELAAPAVNSSDGTTCDLAAFRRGECPDMIPKSRFQR